MRTPTPTAGSEGFAVWLTGLPASGKSTVARALAAALSARDVAVEHLESDALRRVLTPHPRYDEEERDAFYGAMAHMAGFLARHGVAAILDGTAHRRAYRARARAEIPRFLEVFVNCPPELCAARDPKGLYRKAREGALATLPGAQAAYEPPESPDLVVHSDREAPEAAAGRIVAHLEQRGWIQAVGTK